MGDISGNNTSLIWKSHTHKLTQTEVKGFSFGGNFKTTFITKILKILGW